MRKITQESVNAFYNRERLNALNGVSIAQKNFVWYLNGKEWDGSWTKI